MQQPKFPECFDCLQGLPLLYDFIKYPWHHDGFSKPSRYNQDDFEQFVDSIPDRCRDQYVTTLL